MANTLKFGAGQWATKEGSTLAYNDENDNYKPLPFDFTRASNATVVNKAGLIETVGNGIPRIDFLGNTQGALKLEPQRTNLITYSSDFPNPYWTKSGATIQGDPSTAGSELIVNGDFATDSDWIKGTGWTISGGKASCDGSNSALDQFSITTIGKTYKVDITVTDMTTASVNVRLGTGSSDIIGSITSNGTYTFYGTVASNTAFRIRSSAGFDGSVDNVSVKEVQGFTSPDGTTNAYKLVENSANSSHYLRVNASNANPSVISVFAKKGEETKIFIGNATFSQGVLFDLDLGVIESGSDGTIENYGNGWYKCSFYRTDLNSWQYISLRGNFTTYQGNGVNGVYLYGAQLEEGSYPTSYIPTQGSAVTRLADTASGSGNADTFNDSEGTLYFEGSALENGGGSNRFISLSDGTSDNLIYIRIDSTASRFRGFARGSSGSYTLVTVNSIPQTDNNKIALVWDATNFRIWINGSERDTTTINDLPIGMNTLSLTDPTGSSPFFGKVKQLQVYNTALTDQELQALTQV